MNVKKDTFEHPFQYQLLASLDDYLSDLITHL